jgi:mannitol/fructose-specific phosphotransferase system IIA component (Ntr-type)
MPFGVSSVFADAGLVFISFGGLTKICSVAEEVKNPGRNIPLGMFLAFSIVMILYAAVVFTTIGLLDFPELSSSLTPISLGASTFMGNWGSMVLAIAAFLAFISTANAGILSASRAPMAMSRDYLLPRFFGKINGRYKTPHVSIIFTTAFMIIVILFLSLEDLVKTASTLKILLFLLVNVSLIVMRESKIQSYRPKFRSPLYPWIQILGIVGYGFLIFEMGAIPLAITGGFIGLGAVWYWIYVRPNVKRQSALMHVVERVTAKELVTGDLEDELRDILIERDNIIEDRFDRSVKDCAILDAKGPLSLEEFFQKVAREFSPRVEIEPKRLFDLLMERERQSTTALHPGLAVPHIIIEGNHKFDLLLARCKEGVSFSASVPPVHTAFILVGTRDERNFHLRALTAIAQVTQEPGFEKSWSKARGPEELRNILLISTRKRIPGK